MLISALVLLLSLGVLIPNVVRVFKEWNEYSNPRRLGESVLVVALAAIAVLGFVDAYGSYRDQKTLEAQLAPRHMNDEQSRILRNAIEPYAGTMVSVAAYSPATDAHELAEEIFAVFRSARWDVRGRPGLAPDVIDVDMTGGPIPEVMVGVNDPGKPSAAAAAVLKAFTDLGYSTEYQAVGIEPNMIQLTVGPKPVASESPRH